MTQIIAGITIESALATILRQRLKADLGVAFATVLPSTEIGPVARAVPKTAFTLTSSPRTYTDSGSTGLVVARFQLDIFASTTFEARAIAKSARLAMDAAGGTTVEGVVILHGRLHDERFAASQPLPSANDAPVRFIQDVSLVYRE